MDITVSAERFKTFLQKCAIGGIIKDLVVHTNGTKGIFAKAADKSRTIYAEVYLHDVKVTEEGNIRIPSLQKLIAIVGQSDSDLLRLKSSKDAVVFTDGNGVGKFNANLLQSSDAEMVESYDPIKDNPAMFDKSSLTYANGSIVYQNGFKLNASMLSQASKDGKAFGFELFKMEVVKGNLKCKIENAATTEKFTRVMADKGAIGSIDSIMTTTVGLGFKEMISVLEKTDAKDQLSLFIDEQSWLITNEKDVYYNLHTLPED